MFKASQRFFYRMVGTVKLDDIKDIAFRAAVNSAIDKQMQEVPEADAVQIKGTTLHLSSTDPDDKEPVISVSLMTKNGSGLGTMHIHENGTANFKAKARTAPGRRERSMAREAAREAEGSGIGEEKKGEEKGGEGTS